jgi:hypothetical protein
MKQTKARFRHPLSVQHVAGMAKIASGYTRAYTTNRKDGTFRVKLFGIYTMGDAMFKSFHAYADKHNGSFTFNKNSVTILFRK